MNELQIFQNKEFGEVRSLVINNEPWFVGKDVAEALGYGEGKSLNNAVAKHVDDEDKGVTEMMTPGGKQNVTIINESGLYSLILSSKLESAKKFKRWVTSEVLPTLRKTGSYAKAPTDPRQLLKLTIEAHEQTAQRVDVLEEKVSDLEKSTTIDSSQQNILERIAKATVIRSLGGVDSRAYQLMSRKIFSSIWRDYKNYFKLGSFRDTLKTEFENAKEYLESWSPEVNVSLKIKEYNSQLSMNLDA